MCERGPWGCRLGTHWMSLAHVHAKIGVSLRTFLWASFGAGDGPRSHRYHRRPDKMCKGLSSTQGQTHERRTRPPRPVGAPKSAFAARRLTPSTFLIVEVDDIFGEEPFIYAKLVPAARTVLLLDTGCGGRTRTPDAEFTRLRDFVERAPVEDNGGRPLNPGGAMGYAVVLSHCHYDHIRTSQ